MVSLPVPCLTVALQRKAWTGGVAEARGRGKGGGGARAVGGNRLRLQKSQTMINR